VKIRFAAPADAAGIAAVEAATWAATYRGLIPDSVFALRPLEQRVALWNQILSDASARVTAVAEDDSGAIVGYCNGEKPHEHLDEYDAEIVGLYVLPTFQRKGCGAMLFSFVAQELERRGHRALLVWVLRANPYRAFYEKLGGSYIGDRTLDLGAPLAVAGYGWTRIENVRLGLERR
jgi:GNAT superfamily N-acetyltransferase